MRRGYDAITDFIFMEDEMEKADVILVAGGSKPQLAERAAELFHSGYAEYIVISGGYNHRIDMTEFDYLSKIATEAGVPEERILREDKAGNTFENAEFSFKVCRDNGIDVEKAILITKTSHSRRAYLTYKTNFDNNVEFMISPIVDDRNITKENWMHDQYKINIVMKEVEKIGRYFKGHIKGID